MRCEEVRELLSPYFDLMLAEAEKLAVEEHLAGCAECRRELQDLQAISRLLQDLGEISAPDGFTKNVMERVVGEQQVGHNQPGHWGHWARWGRLGRWGKYAVAAACLIAAVALGSQVNFGGMSSPDLANSVARQGGSSATGSALGDSVSKGKVSGGSASEDTASGGSASGSIAQRKLALGSSVPQDLASGNTVPRVSASGNTAPQDSVLESTAVQKAPSEVAAPQDSASGNTAPQDSTSETDTRRNTASKVEVPRDDSAAKSAAPQVESAANRKVIQTGRIDLEVTDLDKTYSRIVSEPQSLGGYVESSSMNNPNGDSTGDRSNRSSYLTLRVPAEQFSRLVAKVKALGVVLSINQQGQDVSAEYYDTQARLRNWQQQEARLLEILKKAKNVEEILRVENELQRVRQEIEVMEGRIKTLGTMADLATLEVQLTQVRSSQVIQVPRDNIWGRAGQAFIETVNFLLDLGGRAVVFLGGFLPVLLVLGVPAGVIYLIRRRRKNENNK